MIILNLIIDTRRIKKDNTYPIVFRITYKSKYSDIQTGFSSAKSDWSFKLNNVKPSHPEYDFLYNKLKTDKVSYLSKIDLLGSNVGVELDTKQIRTFLLEKDIQPISVKSFWENEIQALLNSNRTGNAQVYKETLSILDKLTNLNVPFEEITYKVLSQLEVELLKRNASTNTISVYLRTFRALFNKAINSDVVSYQHYPFRAFKIKRESTVPRAITIEELHRFFNLEVKPNCYLYESWLLGKLMFLLIGINFKDLIFLELKNIENGRLIYKRSKTKRIYSIKLLPEALKIIEYFKAKDYPTLFGRIAPKDLENKNKLTPLIRQRNKVFNSHLYRLGKCAEIERELTGYVFRYTWANIAKQLGISNELIAESLGHDYGNKVTNTYTLNFDSYSLDTVNDRVSFVALSKISVCVNSH